MKLTACIIDFLSHADFLAQTGSTAIFWSTRRCTGIYYGTLREPVLSNLKNGVDVLIDIDTQGAATIRNSDDPIVRQALADIFIMPPDVEELRRRLMKRGTETAQQIESRLATAMREMELRVSSIASVILQRQEA